MVEFCAIATDLGAVADGSTDDGPALNAAITSVANAGGGKLFLPAGVYRTNETINFKANVLVEGEFGGTMIEAGNSTNLVGIFASSGAIPFFGLRNVILNGRRSNQSGFPGTSVGLKLNHSSTSAGFGGNSLIASGNEVNDAYALIENVIIVAVDGDGIQGAGSVVHFKNVIVIGCHGVGISTAINDAEWWGVTAGGCAEEGWTCFAGSGRYYGCKAFFVGTGFNPSAGTYGNYTNGCGFRITNRFQIFVGCEGQDTDGPAFRIQESGEGDILLSGCYSSQGCNLIGTSGNIGQNPLRGGGWAQTRSAFDISGDHHSIYGHVRDRILSVNPGQGFDPDLDCAVNVRSGSNNCLISVAGNYNVLETPGTTPWVLDNGTDTNTLHNRNAAS
jgi:hypothetical protein